MSKFELFSKSLARENFLRNKKTSITSAGIRRGNFSNSVNDILQEFKTSNLDLQVMELQEHDIDSLLFELKKFCVDKVPVIVLDYLQIIPSNFQDTSAKQANPRQIQLKCLKNRQGTNYDCFFNYFPANDCFEVCNKNDFEDLIFPNK